MTHHTFDAMGTVGSLTGVSATAASTVRAIFEEADARFSLYRADSELSRVASGAQTMINSSTELRDAYADALSWRALTGGAFTPNRSDGVVDLNGIVKAKAMQAAGEALQAGGWLGWSLNVGGDVLVADAHSQSVGIVDPVDRTALLCVVTLRETRRAMATSGSAERGDHIWLAGTTERAQFAQVTVVADDIITADVLATAIVSGGAPTLNDLTDRWDIDVLAVDRNGAILATPGIRTALVV
ncbi:MAG: FAD:protein FMN transferase [Rhodoglobus sp.]